MTRREEFREHDEAIGKFLEQLDEHVAGDDEAAEIQRLVDAGDDGRRSGDLADAKSAFGKALALAAECRDGVRYLDALRRCVSVHKKLGSREYAASLEQVLGCVSFEEMMQACASGREDAAREDRAEDAAALATVAAQLAVIAGDSLESDEGAVPVVEDTFAESGLVADLDENEATDAATASIPVGDPGDLWALDGQVPEVTWVALGPQGPVPPPASHVLEHLVRTWLLDGDLPEDVQEDLQLKPTAVTVACVDELPRCDRCGNAPARYDAPDQAGNWGYLCEDCYRANGSGTLGNGRGQYLLTMNEVTAPVRLGFSVARDYWAARGVSAPDESPFGS